MWRASEAEGVSQSGSPWSCVGRAAGGAAADPPTYIPSVTHPPPDFRRKTGSSLRNDQNRVFYIGGGEVVTQRGAADRFTRLVFDGKKGGDRGQSGTTTTVSPAPLPQPEPSGEEVSPEPVLLFLSVDVE